jgi:hypothetical protein
MLVAPHKNPALLLSALLLIYSFNSTAQQIRFCGYSTYRQLKAGTCSNAPQATATRPGAQVYKLELYEAATARQQAQLQKQLKAYEGVQSVEIITASDIVVTGDKRIDIDRIKEIVVSLNLEIAHFTFHLQ